MIFLIDTILLENVLAVRPPTSIIAVRHEDLVNPQLKDLHQEIDASDRGLLQFLLELRKAARRAEWKAPVTDVDDEARRLSEKTRTRDAAVQRPAGDQIDALVHKILKSLRAGKPVDLPGMGKLVATLQVKRAG